MRTQPININRKKKEKILVPIKMSDSLVLNAINIPEEILGEIWLMVGLESLESLHRCRQVCQAWNELIMKNIWKNPSKRNIMATRIQRNWGPGMLPSSEDISHAKWLGRHRITSQFVLN